MWRKSTDFENSTSHGNFSEPHFGSKLKWHGRWHKPLVPCAIYCQPFTSIFVLKNICPAEIYKPLFWKQRPQRAASSVLHSCIDTYGDHLLNCEKDPHRVWRQDEHVKQLTRYLAKAARHPVAAERSVGRHRHRLDISALGGTELLNVRGKKQ